MLRGESKTHQQLYDAQGCIRPGGAHRRGGTATSGSGRWLDRGLRQRRGCGWALLFYFVFNGSLSCGHGVEDLCHERPGRRQGTDFTQPVLREQGKDMLLQGFESQRDVELPARTPTPREPFSGSRHRLPRLPWEVMLGHGYETFCVAGLTRESRRLAVHAHVHV